MRSEEYDAFGPWIIEIDEASLIPPLFQKHVSFNQPYSMLFKVPRDIERKNANPDMDLYDYVVGIIGQEIHIYKREDQNVTFKAITINHIIQIEVSNNLLSSYAVFITSDDLYSFTYNSVSTPIVHKFVQLIRNERKYKRDGIIFKTKGKETLDDATPFFKNTYDQFLSEESKLDILALQPIIHLEYNHLPLLQKKYNKLFYGRSAGTLVLTNSKELIIIRQGKELSSEKDADYSYSMTYIPIDCVYDFNMKIHEKTPEIDILSINNTDILLSHKNEDKDLLIDNLIKLNK